MLHHRYAPRGVEPGHQEPAESAADA
jgi:hypothetical protein